MCALLSNPQGTLLHPSGASRWLNQPEKQAPLKRAIGHLRRAAA